MAPRRALFFALALLALVGLAAAGEQAAEAAPRRKLQLFDTDGVAASGVYDSFLEVLLDEDFGLLPGGIFGDIIPLLAVFLAPLGGLIENGIELLVAPFAEIGASVGL